MIEVMHRFASHIFPIRYFFILLAFLSLFCFIFITLSGDKTLDVYLFPSVTSFGWSICLYGIADAFRSVPEGIKEGDGFLIRFKKRIRMSIVWLWSVGFMICTLLLVYLSIKSVSMALGGS